MSLTADSKTLAVVKLETQANVWVAPMGDVSRARPVTSGAGTVGWEVTFTPDGGRIVYSSSASGEQDIWIVNADGSSSRQLTANARVNGYPSVSPDGRSILFFSDRSGVPHTWRMNIDGSDQRQLTQGSGEQSARFSPDGRWVVYRKSYGKATVWRIPADGGEPVQLSDKNSAWPTVSPDSKLVAYFYRDENTPVRIAVTPLEGGEPLKTFDLPTTFRYPLRWTPDGRALAYVDTKNGVSNIVAQPFDGGAPKQLTDFKADRIFWFDFSRDGRQLALSRGTQTSDVILIKDFR
jgi:Tol biopolymer transport system component